jgi:hypothetical protein
MTKIEAWLGGGGEIRTHELREELENAKELGNVERAERAEHEIDALTRNSREPAVQFVAQPCGLAPSASE